MYLKFDALSAEATFTCADIKSNDDNKHGAKLFRLLPEAYLSRGARTIQLLIASIKFRKIHKQEVLNSTVINKCSKAYVH